MPGPYRVKPPLHIMQASPMLGLTILLVVCNRDNGPAQHTSVSVWFKYFKAYFKAELHNVHKNAYKQLMILQSQTTAPSGSAERLHRSMCKLLDNSEGYRRCSRGSLGSQKAQTPYTSTAGQTTSFMPNTIAAAVLSGSLCSHLLS